MSPPSFSCVIPTHERPDLLRQSLSSVIEQTVCVDQIIVVSDVSDPQADRICTAAAARYPGIEILYVHDPSALPGASGSRNRGAQEASADYIGFLDDDDLWKPNLIEEVSRVVTGDVDMVVVSREIFSEGSSYPGPRIKDGLRPKDVVAASLGTTGSNMMVSSVAFNAIGGFDSDLPVKNDTDFFFRFLLAGYSYATVQENLVRQRKHQGGQLTSKNERRAAGTELYIKKHREQLSGRDMRKLRLTIHRIRRHASTSKREKAQHLLGALANYSLSDFFRERREWKMWHQADDRRAVASEDRPSGGRDGAVDSAKGQHDGS